MIRKQDWETQLSIYLEKVKDKPFKRGQHDCALFVADCIEVMTGVNFTMGFRGKYNTKKAAFKLLKEKGYDGLKDIAMDKLGEPYSNINFAKRGDIVTIQCKEGISLAIIDLSGRAAITTTENNLDYYPKEFWIEAWGV